MTQVTELHIQCIQPFTEVPFALWNAECALAQSLTPLLVLCLIRSQSSSAWKNPKVFYSALEKQLSYSQGALLTNALCQPLF